MFKHSPRPTNGYCLTPVPAEEACAEPAGTSVSLAKNLLSLLVILFLGLCAAASWWHETDGAAEELSQRNAVAEAAQRARSGVKAVALTTDGRTVAAGVNDGRIVFHSTGSGQASAPSLHQLYAVRCLAFSPGGALLAAGGGDWGSANGELGVWLWETGALVAVLEAPAFVNAVHFTPDGKHLIAANEKGALQRWRTDTWQPLGDLRCSSAALRCMALAPDGSVLAVGDDNGRISLVRLPHATLVSTWRAHAGMVCSLAYGPDGELLASGGGDSAARVWRSGKDRPVFECCAGAGHCRAVAFTPDGAELLTSAGLVRAPAVFTRWTLGARLESSSLRGHPGDVFALAVDRSGKYFASAGDGEVRLWRPNEIQAFRVLDCSASRDEQ